MAQQQNWTAPPVGQGWTGGGGGGGGGGYSQAPQQGYGYGGSGSPRAGPGPTDPRRRPGPGHGDPRQRPAPLDMQQGGAGYNGPPDTAPAPVAQSPGSIFNSLFELGLIGGGGAAAAVNTGGGGLGAVLENAVPVAQAPVAQQPKPQQPKPQQPQPQRAPVQQRTPYSQSAASAAPIPEIKLVYSELVKRYPGAIAALHPKGSQQCKTCGLRFPGNSKHEYKEHLDWHFRSNQEKNDTTKARSRHWFVPMHEWVHYTDDMSREERSRSDVFGDAAPQEADQAGEASVVSSHARRSRVP